MPENKFKAGDKARAIESSGGGVMRIKVGDQWFKCEPGQPIMVELADGDKRNIANMNPEATRYALFDDDDGWSNERKLAWMGEGSQPDRVKVTTFGEEDDRFVNGQRDGGSTGEDDDLIAEWQDEPEEAAPLMGFSTISGPAIVARLDNGQPLSATRPHVHASVADASKEATRLAKANPGREFAVYEMVHTVTEQRTYDHEWQNAAKEGREYDAACLLQDAAGTSFHGAQAAVTHWLSVTI